MAIQSLRFALVAFVLLTGVNFNAYAIPVWGSLDGTRMTRWLSENISITAHFFIMSVFCMDKSSFIH